MDNKTIILKKAQELFFRYGVKSVSMDNVASHLGMSKKTIYAHVEDKKDLLYQCMKQYFENYKQECETLRENGINGIDKMMKLSASGLKQFKSLNPSLLFDLQKYYRNSWQIFLDFKNEYIANEMKEELKQGIEEGLFREDLNIEITVIVHLIEIEAALNPFIFDPQKFTLNEIFKNIQTTFLRGIATEKGLKYFQDHIKDKEFMGVFN